MIEVVAQRCDGCGVCVDACPARAIAIVAGIARIDPERCRLCEACLDACPRDALVRSEAPVVVVRPSPVTEALPAATNAAIQRPSWLVRAAPLAASVVGFVGREVLPLVIDRLAAPTAEAGQRSTPVDRAASAPSAVVHRQRRRYRGGRS